MSSGSSVKPNPARPATHQSHEIKTGGVRKCKVDTKQLDPDELKRKLEAHLVQLRVEAIQRRPKAEASQSKYHHVPRFAATDFARTATPEPTGQKERGRGYAYKVAQAALKNQTGEDIQLRAGYYDLQQTQALDKARRQRSLIADRNQFQRTRDLEDAAKADKERKLYVAPRRTFRNNQVEVDQEPQSCRRLSAGDLKRDEDVNNFDPTFHVNQKPKVLHLPTADDRQDWAQRDELPVDVRRSMIERVTPLLRRPDSKWILKRQKEPRAEISLLKTNHGTTTAAVKNEKLKFLGLFKRLGGLSKDQKQEDPV